MRIVFRAHILRDACAALAARHGAEFVAAEDEATLHDALPNADALWLWPAFYDADLVRTIAERAPQLRWIALPTMGYDQVEAHGIPDGVTVTTAGDAYAPTVAEHAIALLLALVRRLHEAQRNADRHHWDQSLAPRIGTLNDATVAVLGFGNIGREVARRLHPFGCRIVAITRSGTPHPLADHVFPLSQSTSALGDADALIVAAPLTNGTDGIVSASMLASLPTRALLVNIARGALVDHAALLAALEAGRLAGAALDVTDPEPLPDGHPLWGRPDVIVTPHVAGYGGTVAGRRLLGILERNLERFATGQPLESCVTLVTATVQGT